MSREVRKTLEGFFAVEVADDKSEVSRGPYATEDEAVQAQRALAREVEETRIAARELSQSAQRAEADASKAEAKAQREAQEAEKQAARIAAKAADDAQKALAAQAQKPLDNGAK